MVKLYAWWSIFFLVAVTQARAAETLDINEGRKHWAFQPIQQPSLPQVQDTSWPNNGVDLFILARLEKAGLTPAPSAAPQVLKRRYYYNLIGLPPHVSEIRDPRSTVDHLLASPHYGERFARHWLDVVRYADSNGVDENAAQINAWRYRDYVVRSFSKDTPFHQFLVEQMAGDLMSADTDALRHEQLIATGFLALGPKVLAEPDKVKMEMDIIDEQIDTIGRAFMGLTLGCARCHDHKFDPIGIADYYSLAGIFKSTKTMDSFATVAKWHENTLLTPETKKLKEKQETLVEVQKQVIAAFTEKSNQELVVEKKLQELPEKPEEHYSQETKQELDTLRKTLERLVATAPKLPSAMGVLDGSVTNVPVFLRGDHNTPGEVQPRRFPRALVADESKPIGDQSSGRMELARWIASRENPLTARVMVNRIWRWHFGRGLVATTDNFGRMGEQPSHPELLDWLAVWFMDHGWSMKKLNRLILNSATYQMSSQASAAALKKDPTNQLYSRAPLRRLEAEPLRDTLLEISGLLDKRIGGYVWTFENYKLVFDHTSEDATTYESVRRAIYLPVIRNHVYDLFTLFDFPDPATVNGRRADSVIAPQALFLMNSPLVLRATKVMANDLLVNESWDDNLRVESLYGRLYNRPASTEEKHRALSFVQKFAASKNSDDGTEDHLAAWQALCQAIIMTNEFVYLQ